MTDGTFLGELLRSPFIAPPVAIVGIVVAVNGGRIAAHRAVRTRLFTLRGGPAVALGLAMLAVGLAVVAVAWIHGLRLRD